MGMFGPSAPALPAQTGNAGKTLSTDGTSPSWVPTGQINTSTVPNALGTANPGSGSSGAMAADATLPMPGLAQLADVDPTGNGDGKVLAFNAAAGKFRPVVVATPIVVPLWMTADNAVCTLPRGSQGKSGDFGASPASGVEHFTFFRADKSLVVNTIRFQTGSTAATTSTLARVGLYTVSGNTKTLVASCANKTSFAGIYTAQNCALTASYTLVPGTIYAVGILQIATTPADLIGGWFNGVFMGASPAMAQVTGSGQTDLAATSATTSAHQFPVYYELVN